MDTASVDWSALSADKFDWSRGVDAPPPDEGAQVSGMQIATLLHDAATELVAELFGAADTTSLSSFPIRPVLRSVSAVFELPLVPGTPVAIGATLGSLSTRSFALITGIWSDEGRRVVAHGTASFVVMDVASRRAVAVPHGIARSLRRLQPNLVLPDIADRHDGRPVSQPSK